MKRIAAAIGFALVALSATSVIQSVREWRMWRAGEARFSEETFGTDTLVVFAGATIRIVDDQPLESAASEVAYEGRLQFKVDEDSLGPSSRAMIRRGRRDIGRYHLWADVWRFTDRASGDSSVWLVRRLQERDERRPRFEVIAIASGKVRRSEILRTWQLGRSYRHFRATQFVREGTSAAFPLSVLEAFYFPLVLLVFPVGSFILGTWLWRVGRRRAPRGAL